MKTLLIMFILCHCTILICQTASAPEIGDGTPANPYQISSLENLYWIAAENDVVPDPDNSTRWSASYLQTVDIDATATSDWFNGEGWIPIGKFYGFSNTDNESFGGYYNGQGHEIQNLFINRNINTGCALFGYADSATIVNLKVTQANILGGENTGVLLGIVVGGTITDCFATGDVTGTNMVGSIVGCAYFAQASLERCSFSGTIESSGPSTGGIVGGMESGAIRNSFYNIAEVTINGQSQITLGALNPEDFAAWQNSGMNLDINAYLELENGDYLINSTSDFLSLMIWGQFSEFVFKLNADIDLAEYPQHYIPLFTGFIKGNGKKVSNFHLESDLSNLGLFGLVINARIEYMSVSGYIISSGLRIGLFIGRGVNVDVYGCYGIGNISGDGINVGGFIGYALPCSISNCFSRVNVAGANFVGGFTSFAGVSVFLSNCYSTGIVYCNASSGGFAGNAIGQTAVQNCYWDVESSGHQNSPVADGRTTAEMTYPYDANTYIGWNFTTLWAEDVSNVQNDGYPFFRWMNHDFITPQAIAPMFGTGTETNPFQIMTLENLLWISLDQNRFGHHYQQTDNIDASSTSRWYDGKGFIPIGNPDSPFTGTYNGSGFEISNLAINRPDSIHVGLFGASLSASFVGIKLSNLHVSGRTTTGGLVGNMIQGSVDHCSTSGFVTARSVVGGLIGFVSGSSISNSYNVASIQGICVFGMPETATMIGGLVGLVDTGAITKCFNLGTVSGLIEVGGMIGKLYPGSVSDSYSIADLYALSGTASSFGGFIGMQANSTIENCYSVGHLHGTSPVGFIGTFVGGNNSFINCYVDVDVSGGNSHPSFIYSRSTSDMTSPYSPDTYENWDFSSIWADDFDHSVNSGYPYLQENSTETIEETIVPVLKSGIYSYPNPFRYSTKIDYFIPKHSSLTEITIYNLRGQQIRRFDVMPEQRIGNHYIHWDGKDQSGRQLASGIYLVRLKTDKSIVSSKIILMK